MSVGASIGPRRRGRRGPWRGPLPVLGGLLALYLLVPIAVLAVHLGSGSGTAPSPGLGSALWVSLLTATISAAIIALFGIPLAWVLAHSRSRLWGAVGVMVQLPLALPPLMSGILLVEVVGPYTLLGQLTGGRLTDTTAAIVVAQTFVAAPFLVIAARSAFETVDPGLIDVAATLGHGGWSRFRRVSLPIAGPGIRAGLLLSWLRAFGEFGATVILAYHPYSLPVFTFVQFSSTGLPTALAPTGVAILAAAVVLTLARARPGRLLAAARRSVGAGSAPALGSAPAAESAHALGSAPAAGSAHAAGAAPAAGFAPAAGLAPAAGQPTGAPPRAPAQLDFDLHTRVGEFDLALSHRGAGAHLALLGPSGAGKSLTLRCLAGLQPGTGHVRLGPTDLTGVRPEQRRIGWVPQDAALMPHLDVWRQVTFGVGADRAAAAAWLARLGIAELADRLPHQLSGGQRQRVALARALARDPELVLLDEPFSSLDRPVRDELRRELRRVQREAGVATVLVTHDPEEAAMLADEVVIVADGRALQAGPRTDVFERPVSPQVAALLAIDNLRTGVVQAPGTLVSDGTVLAVDGPGPPVGTSVTWCVRAERVLVAPAPDGRVDATVDPAHARGAIPATIEDVLDLGALRELLVTLDGGLRLTAKALGAAWQLPGARCAVTVAPAEITLWRDGDTPGDRASASSAPRSQATMSV